MSAIIYEKTANGLYPTGERSVSTFPSGLIKVDQAFFCRTSAAATHRAALAVGANMPGGTNGAIDGLKIFPAPQEEHRDDGFTEFFVTAYGRINQTGRTKIEWKISTLAGTYEWFVITPASGTTPATTTRKTKPTLAIYKNTTKTVERVYTQNEIASMSFDTNGVIGYTLVSGRQQNVINYNQFPTIASYQSVPYGFFVEVTYTIDMYRVPDDSNYN